MGVGVGMGWGKREGCGGNEGCCGEILAYLRGVGALIGDHGMECIREASIFRAEGRTYEVWHEISKSRCGNEQWTRFIIVVCGGRILAYFCIKKLETSS